MLVLSDKMQSKGKLFWRNHQINHHLLTLFFFLKNFGAQKRQIQKLLTYDMKSLGGHLSSGMTQIRPLQFFEPSAGSTADLSIEQKVIFGVVVRIESSLSSEYENNG